MLSRPAFLAFVVPGDAELRLGLGDLDKSSEARLDATDSAVPGRLEDSLLRVSLFDPDLGENMSFLMMGEFWEVTTRDCSPVLGCQAGPGKLQTASKQIRGICREQP